MIKWLKLGMLVGGMMLISGGRAVASCEVTPSVNSVRPSSDFSMEISVKNTGDTPITWVKVPLDSISLLPSLQVSIQSSAWIPNVDTSNATYFSGSIDPGQTLNFSVNGHSSDQEGSVEWNIQTSPNFFGDPTESCVLNNLAVSSLVPTPEPTPIPALSELSVMAGPETATISWKTDLPASAMVIYGVSPAYGDTSSGDSGTTTHTVVLRGLLPSTVYHFVVQSANQNGTIMSGDNTFTTAEPGATTVITTTVTELKTNIVTQTQTQTETVTRLVGDSTPPVIKIDSLLAKAVYQTAPTITGSAVDDRGVARVEYRIQTLESSWSIASLDSEVGAKKTTFEFLPPLTLDGTYTLELRGIDVFGNISTVKTTTFVIDQMPPTVGGGMVSFGAIPLWASQGVVKIMASTNYEVVLYENGGADSLTLTINDRKYPVTKMGTDGLWRAVIQVDEPGQFVSKVEASDGAGNTTEREWIKFVVVNRGRILQNGRVEPLATVRVYWLNPVTKRYQDWNVKEYTQTTMQQQSGDGKWGYVLPKGEYYLEAEVNTVKFVSQKIQLAKTTLVASDWEVGSPNWWERLLEIRHQAQVDVTQPQPEGVRPQLPVAREKWIGRKAVVYIGTSYLPWDGEEKLRSRAWAKDENAEFIELAEQGVDDLRGEWLKPLSVGLLPKVYLIDAKGDTVDYKEGVWER